MIKYDTKNRILHLSKSEEVKLSKKEHELLICLSNGNLVQYDEIYKMMNTSKAAFNPLKTRFLDKVDCFLNIKTIRNVGLILEDEIYFE